jgi:Fe-S-cluster-containing hydrogenase component 2
MEIDLIRNYDSIQKAIKSLESGRFRKIICGAANSSEKQVERISLVYSLSGIDVIDIGPDKKIFEAANSGILKAQKISEKNSQLYPGFFAPVIMVSVKSGDDKHFRKAVINVTKCVQCLECVKHCQSNSLTKRDEILKLDNEKCFGCARCVEVCQNNAINMVKIHDNPEKDILKPGKISALEIHTGNSSIDELKAYVELNNILISTAKLVSVSVDTSRFNNKELLEYCSKVVKMFQKKIILQVDGLSMKGGGDKSSTVHTIAAAATISEAKINAYIVLSGGTNHITRELVEKLGVPISGISYGTFARKIILSYIDEYQENEFMANLHKIVNITRSLSDK